MSKMLNRFAKLDDYMEAGVQEVQHEKPAYAPKSVFSNQRYEPKNAIPEAFINTRENQGQKKEHVREDNPVFRMNRKHNPMEDNAAFGQRKHNPMEDNAAFGQRKHNPMETNEAFSNQRRNNLTEPNSAFSNQRRSMNDNPAFASKKRLNDDQQDRNGYTQQRTSYKNYIEQEPPKPKTITDADIKNEELFPTLGSPKAIKTPSATTSVTNTATNTPKATSTLPLSSSFKDLVVKAAEREEQAKKVADEKKRRAKEKEMERRHTRVISFSIRTPGLRPQFSYDDDLGDLVDPAERTPYCSRIEEDGDDLYDDVSIGLDEDNY